MGESDALVGVNLLREGIDVPEVSLVCILDADKEGFLRSATSLIQTAGRAARHVDGRVILYADNITGSLKTALDTCRRRREEQMRHNAEFGITPQSVSRPIQQPLVKRENKFANVGKKSKSEVARLIDELQQEMLSCADRLDFERAAVLRDQIKFIRENCAK